MKKSLKTESMKSILIKRVESRRIMLYEMMKRYAWLTKIEIEDNEKELSERGKLVRRIVDGFMGCI